MQCGASTPNIYLVKATAAPAADFNGDGEVDGDDLAVWRQTFGQTLSQGKLPGDANGDGRADGSDFLAWQRSQAPAGVASATTTPDTRSERLSSNGLTRDFVFEDLSQVASELASQPCPIRSLLMTKQNRDQNALLRMPIAQRVASFPPVAQARGIPSAGDLAIAHLSGKPADAAARLVATRFGSERDILRTGFISD